MQSVQLLQSRFSYNEIWWPQTHSPTLDMDICTFIHWSGSNTVNCIWMCDIIELMKLYQRTKMWQKWHISRFNKLRPTKLAHGWIFVDMGALLPFKILFHYLNKSCLINASLTWNVFIFFFWISNFQWFTFLQTFNAWIAHIHIVTTEKNTTSAIIEARGVGYNPSRWRMKKKHKRQIILPRILSKLSVGFVLSMTRKRRRGLSSSSSFLLDLMINVFPSRWDLQFLHKWLQNVHVMFFF